MNKHFEKIIQLLILLTILPFAHADMPAGPELIIIPIIFLAMLGGFIVGIVYLAYLLLKWIKNKYAKK